MLSKLPPAHQPVEQYMHDPCMATAPLPPGAAGQSPGLAPPGGPPSEGTRAPPIHEEPGPSTQRQRGDSNSSGPDEAGVVTTPLDWSSAQALQAERKAQALIESCAARRAAAAALPSNACAGDSDDY